MLIGLGFPPLEASALSLIANTAPVAFGALGTPIIALQGVTGLDLGSLSAMVGRQLPFFSRDRAVLVDRGVLGFSRDARGVAGAARRGAVVRDSAIPRVELPRALARRHRRVRVLDARARDFPAVLATRAIRAGRRGRRTSRHRARADGAAAPRRAHSVDRSRRRRVRVGYAAGQEFSQPHLRAEHSDRRPGQDGRCASRRSSPKADERTGGVLAQLAVGDRDGDPHRGDHRRVRAPLLGRPTSFAAI